MELRFPEFEILDLAKQYLQYWSRGQKTFEREEELMDEVLIDQVQQQGYLDIELLKTVALWHFPQSAHHIDSNSESDVRKITGNALEIQGEIIRLEVLTDLTGLGFKTASAVLHFFHKEKYPIINEPAMWSLSVDEADYSYEYWLKYVDFCRDHAERNSVDMRTLDRALWMYSKENQPSR
ncbi:hypothetical protein C6497_11930 [Candidatus Poribacteria bacterium]|nr:MAG: hypothetical protein C6497_11930 [Candidatus Poribacteria bacterium]